MYSVRKLIMDSYRASTVRGVGDVPDSEETEEALVRLNDILDELSGKPEFAHSKVCREVAVRNGKVVIGENRKREIVNAVSGDDHSVTVTVADNHGLSVGEDIFLSFKGMSSEIGTKVSVVFSPFSFKTEPVSEVSGVLIGSFRSERDEESSIVDIFDCPPANIFQVLDQDGRELPEMQEASFFGNVNGSGSKWWFYDKRYSPFPKVWVNGCSAVRIVYEEPFWHDLGMDDDLENMPKSARSAVKWLLASALAEENGYIDISERQRKRGMSILNDWFRNNYQDQSALPDTTAPGYSHGRYNIFNDTGA